MDSGARSGPAPVVVPFPEEIDVTNAEHVGAEFSTAFGPDATVVIADLTRTLFCDSAGVRCLLQAGSRAAQAGAEFRLAAGSAAVLRLLQLTGIDRRFTIYPDLETAVAGGESIRPDN
jgi:anti-sigma B factor antagonist